MPSLSLASWPMILGVTMKNPKRTLLPFDVTPPPTQVGINLDWVGAVAADQKENRELGGVYQCPEGVVRLVNAGIKISPGQTGTGVALIGSSGEDVSIMCAATMVSWQDGINAKPYGLLSFMVPGGWFYSVIGGVDAVKHYWVEWDLGGTPLLPE